MTQNFHLVIPMSGQGIRYQKAGYQEPKPLIPINGKPMIEKLLESFPESWACTFVMAENHRNSPLPGFLKKLRPKASQIFIPPHKTGPAKAIEAALQSLSPTERIFVSYCDYGMIWDSRAFEKFVETSDCDSCVIAYRGFHAHYLSPTPYAYCRMDGERVVEVREKGSFTDNREQEFASSGGYYFKNREILKNALSHQYAKDLQINGEFYTSLTVEALLQLDPKADVRVFEIPSFFQWGTPQDLEAYAHFEKTFENFLRASGKVRPSVGQILMPMAGAGSRFSTISKRPKPLILMDGLPMFERALNTLPRPEKKEILVTLESFADQILPAPKRQIVRLSQTPEGQALSTEAALDCLEPKSDFIISSCDHGIVLDPEKFARLREDLSCDAAIFSIRNFPGALRRPKAFAYLKVDSSLFVTQVSVKTPLSDQPHRDPLLVGTFWFKNSEILRLAISELKNKNLRVNNELYLDSALQCLIDSGKKVKMIELDGYLCWGDPDSLAETLYWHEVFSNRRMDFRTRFPGVL